MINKIHDIPSFSLFNNYEIIKKLKYKVNEIIDKLNEPAPEPVDVLPSVTSDDNGEVLTVVEGVWNKAELPAVPKPVNYSTTEKVIGTWIDGKPLYEKTFTYNNKVLGTTAEDTGLTHDLINLGVAWVEKAMWKFTNDDNYWNDISTIKTRSGSTYSYWHGQMTIGDGVFYDTYNGNTMNASTDRSYIVVARYTKSTD